MPLKPVSDWLRASIEAPLIGVDREAGILRGYVVAQEGPFKTPGRGEFDKAALKEIVRLMRAAPGGLKSRFSHPNESDDGLGKFLGRVKSPRMDVVSVAGRDVAAVRADLHFDATALAEPPGGGKPLGVYVMDLAESDAAALSSSLVLQAAQEHRLEKDGRPKRGDDGEPLPPLWRPTRLHASDVVDTGDAVDGILGASVIDGLPNAVVFRATELLDMQFPDADRRTVEARCREYLGRYLDWRYGAAGEDPHDVRRRNNLPPIDMQG